MACSASARIFARARLTSSWPADSFSRRHPDSRRSVDAAIDVFHGGVITSVS